MPANVIEVRYHRGLYLPEPDLWLDPRDAKACAFVSHAHADHFARHESAICSPVTALLLRDRFRIAESRLDPVAFHVPVVRGGFRLRLLPAGHIAGSAMLHITRLADNATLLYTGDFKARRSRTAEPVSFLTADTLILETTFGLPGYEFPNAMEVEAEVMRFVGDAFADGATPILLAYSLGKAQEAIALLEEHNIPVLQHPTVAAMTHSCRQAGVPGLPEPLEFDGHAPPGHVIIAPPNAIRTELFKGLKSKRTAMLSGWAMQPGAKFRYRVDAMIPFSDHADHPGLMECIQRVRPKRVLTVHGFEREFAAELRTKNINAWSAAGGDQMELPIQRNQARHQPTRGQWHKRVVCQLADFSDLCKLVAETGSRVAKAGFVSSYLAGLPGETEVRIAVQWLSGEITTPVGEKHASRLDRAALRHALIGIPGGRDERFREIQQATRDSIRTARQFLQEITLHPDVLDLAETSTFIDTFRASKPSIARIQGLSSRLATLHPAEGETLIKLLSGSLQLGLDPILIEESIASAFKANQEELRNAIAITGSLAAAAELAKQKRLDQAESSHTAKPIRSVTANSSGDLPFLSI